MDIILYSTNCPKCKVLKQKLDAKNLDYYEVTDVNKMLNLGIQSAPALQIDDKPVMSFGEAIKWVNKVGGEGR